MTKWPVQTCAQLSSPRSSLHQDPFLYSSSKEYGRVSRRFESLIPARHTNQDGATSKQTTNIAVNHHASLSLSESLYPSHTKLVLTTLFRMGSNCVWTTWTWYRLPTRSMNYLNSLGCSELWTCSKLSGSVPLSARSEGCIETEFGVTGPWINAKYPLLPPPCWIDLAT